jgi:simple sugar transport system ATP-binding protein
LTASVPELELRGISKRFPGVLANDRIDLVVEAGTIHAVVGENGAGKTTLMSILYGLVQPDAGEIRVRGKVVDFSSPLDAIAAGLGMVHQAFKLFPTLTVAENVVYRSEPTKGWFLDRDAAVAEVRKLADGFGLGVDPKARVEDLPVGVLQRVEIVKALYRDARVLILDEPTAVLAPQERDGLFGIMRRLKEAGHTILFVTHKLNEVMAISDRVTVLRAGRVVADLETESTSPRVISRLMTGRDIETVGRNTGENLGKRLLEVSNLGLVDESGIVRLTDVSFEVRAGEIVGIAAVAGNGQSELIDALTGLRQATSGRIALNGADITDAEPAERRAGGLAYVPEDRHRVGTAAGGEVWSNLLMGYQRSSRFRRGRWLRRPVVRDHARQLIGQYDVRVGSEDTLVGTLSGGNLQKVVVAREMTQPAELLIADQPTRGVDIGAIEFLHRRLLDYREQSRGILLISADLSELLSLSNRILVMYEGRIVAELDAAHTDEAGLGIFMTGGHLAGADHG